LPQAGQITRLSIVVCVAMRFRFVLFVFLLPFAPSGLPLVRAANIIDVALGCKVKGDSPLLCKFSVWGSKSPWKAEFPTQVERAMTKQLTISKLAKAVGVPTTTLRYYERVGLVKPEDRSQGNYRLFGGESLRRLKFIRAAQSIGFTLDDVKTLLGIHEAGTPSCRDVQALAGKRLTDIAARLKDLRHVQRVLKSALRKCIESEQRGCCHVIETLRNAS
jgi:MerR family mercuric resistance operon transcriptional regulator